MAGIGSVVIQFIGKDNLSKVAGKVAGAIGDVDDSSGKAQSSFGKLNAAWAAALPIAGAVIGAGVALANGLIDAGKAAMEDKESADRLAHTLGNIPGVTQKAIDSNEAWISSMQLATQVADTDLRDAVGKLTLATGDLGEAQRLTALAVDVASGSGKNLETVTDALAKAVNGNTGALKRQFPWLDANKDGTVTLDEAVQGLTGAYKDSAKEAAKTKPWETLKIVMDELKESIGAWLLPVMEDLSAWFADPKNQKKIQDFLDQVTDLAAEIGDDLVQALKDLIAWLKKPENQQKIQDWIDMFKDLAQVIRDVWPVIKTLIDWMNKIPPPPVLLSKLAKIPGAGGILGTKSAGPQAAGRAAGGTPSDPVAQPATVLVTEEQIYRAVSRLMARGDARNGRLVRTA